MECIIEKLSNNQVVGWTARCYRLRNIELIQYKKSIESFKEATDKTIKHRYNLYQISQVNIQNTKPYQINLHFLDGDTLSFKFNRKSVEIDKNDYIAWFRIISCSAPYHNKCQFRNIPSNISFALYYTLQKLYQHKALLSTQYIFQKS